MKKLGARSSRSRAPEHHDRVPERRRGQRRARSSPRRSPAATRRTWRSSTPSHVADFASRDALVNLDNYIARSDVVKPDDYVAGVQDVRDVRRAACTGCRSTASRPACSTAPTCSRRPASTAPPTTWDEFAGRRREADRPRARSSTATSCSRPRRPTTGTPGCGRPVATCSTEDGKQVAFNSAEGKKAADFYVGLDQVRAAGLPQLQLLRRPGGLRQGQVGDVHGRRLVRRRRWTTSSRRSTGKWAAAPLPEGPAGCAHDDRR